MVKSLNIYKILPQALKKKNNQMIVRQAKRSRLQWGDIISVSVAYAEAFKCQCIHKLQEHSSEHS